MITYNNASYVVDELADLFTEAIVNVGKNYTALNNGERTLVHEEFKEMIDRYKISVTPDVIDQARTEGYDVLAMVLCNLGYSKVSRFTAAQDILSEGRKVTIVKLSEFGFPNVMQVRIDAVKTEKYAQYDDTLKIVFIPKRKRTKYGVRVLPEDEILIYDGWIDINFDSLMYGKIEDKGAVIVKTGKYNCFDKRYLTDAVDLIGKNPIYSYGL